VRHAGAHHPGVLRHVDHGNPVVDPLVFLVVDNLRFHLVVLGLALIVIGSLAAAAITHISRRPPRRLSARRLPPGSPSRSARMPPCHVTR